MRSTPLLLAVVLLTACDEGIFSFGNGGSRGAIAIDDPATAQPDDVPTTPDDTPTAEPPTAVPWEDQAVPVDFAPRVIQDCDTDAGYAITGFANAPIDGVPEVTAIGIYQTHGEHSGGDHPMGYADLTVTAPGEQIVVLSSYEPVTWDLEVGADTTVTRILVYGYHEQLVENADGIDVTYMGDWQCGLEWPTTDDCASESFADAIVEELGQPIQHFEGCYDASSFVVGPTESPVPTTPAPIIQDCATDAGYQVDSHHVPNTGSDSDVWLVGIYETHGEHSGGNHPMGYATVDVSAAGTHTIVLSSYEPVTWSFDIAPGSTVDEILVYGYHEQIVEGAGAVPVTMMEGACGYSLPYNGGGCDTDDLFATVEADLGRPVHHYEGCYQATAFQIADAAPVPPAPLTDPNGVPTSGVPCGPGETVELAFPISADQMASGASDPNGAGWCSGEVTFGADLSLSMTGMWNDATGTVELHPYNGYNQESCGTAHCNDLTYP